MTLEELLSKCAETMPTTAQPGTGVDPRDLAWWIVVVSKKPAADGKPRAKFVSAYAEQTDAAVNLDRRVNAEAERIGDLAAGGIIEEPFRFAVIERPFGGRL